MAKIQGNKELVSGSESHLCPLLRNSEKRRHSGFGADQPIKASAENSFYQP
jgi:hypothetical protein